MVKSACLRKLHELVFAKLRIISICLLEAYSDINQVFLSCSKLKLHSKPFFIKEKLLSILMSVKWAKEDILHLQYIEFWV